jgi:hypothetical protein
MEVTLNLPENIYLNFSKLAEKKHRRVEEVITDKLQTFYSANNDDYAETIASWTDNAVLTLAKLKVPTVYSDQMGNLLEKLDEGTITDSEERELEVYTEICQISTLRKAFGIAEAFKRGLITSPDDLK